MRIINRLAAGLAALAIAGGLAACSGSHSLTAKVMCGEKVISWYSQGGKADLTGLGSAAKAVGIADEAFAKEKARTRADAAPVVKATRVLGTAIAKLAKDPAPGCVPGARDDIRSGLTDFSAAVASEDQLVAAAEAKNATAVQSASKAGAKAFEAGGMKFLAAAKALKSYLAGH